MKLNSFISNGMQQFFCIIEDICFLLRCLQQICFMISQEFFTYYKLKGNMGVKHLCTKDMSDGEKNKKIRPALFKAIASPICKF